MEKKCLLYEVRINILADEFFPKINGRPGDHDAYAFPI
jgi:hypothetical protein